MKSAQYLAVVATATLALASFGSAAQAARAMLNSVHQARNVPAALRSSFYQVLAEDLNASYSINENGCVALAKQKLKACFNANGAHFTGAKSLSLHLVAFGRSGTLRSVETVSPTFRGNRVNYKYGNLTEWWRVLPVGFEQGFTISERPIGRGELTLVLATNRQGADASYGSTLAWDKFRYGKLAVTDAHGNVIPSRLKSKDNRILIAVNDAHAVYPLTVDPLVWIEQKVAAAAGKSRSEFGLSVAMDRDIAVIGVPSADVGGNDRQGAAYVFVSLDGNWTQKAKLTASDGAAFDQFGLSVAVSDKTVLVGAPAATVSGHNDQGAVYAFLESDAAWTQTAKLTAIDGAAGDEFGARVALDGTTALVSAPSGEVEAGHYSQGVVYAFSQANGGWTQADILSASDGTPYDYFGLGVTISDYIAVITAPYAAIGNNGSQGKAYVFVRKGGGWIQTEILTANTGGKETHFGRAVTVDGTTALVGGMVNVNGDHRNLVFVFAESNDIWTQEATLTASDGTAGDGFGTAIALDGSTALIGAFFANVGGNFSQGAAYVFSQSNGTWTQTAKLTATDGGASNIFGKSVAIDGANMLVGSPQATIDSNWDQGAAYFYGSSDLGLTVSAPLTVGQGQQYTSQAILTNSSNHGSPAVSAMLAVPSAASFIGANATQGSCDEDSGVVICDFGAISGNAGTATANVTFEANGEIGDALHNTASIIHATPSLTTSLVTQIVANQPPVAQSGTLTTDENTAANGTLKASDPDGDALVFSIVSKPGHGSVTLDNSGTGAYAYTPDSGYSGSDSFTFKANDGQVDSNTATISITVSAAPSPPPPSPPSGGGGGGMISPLGLALLLFAGFVVYLRRKL